MARLASVARDQEKPPYRIPTLAETSLAPRTGLKVASTFSGAGGGCYGWKLAGYDVVWASEFVPAAAETYALNFPEAVLDQRDIRTVSAEEVLAATGLGVGELDVLEGSPPCASFSLAGRRQQYWGAVKSYSDVEQRIDDLFDEFLRLVGGLRPKVAVAENVGGLTQGVAVGFFNDVLSGLRDRGYQVEAQLLDAQWLGVPQSRARVIIVAVRSDLGVAPAFPSPLPWRYSIRDALSGVPVEEEPPGAVLGRNLGQEWWGLPRGARSPRYFNFIRSHPDRPVQTVTAMGGLHAGFAAVTHPDEPRKFSIAELRRLCGFPDDFVLTGTYSQRWERLGRAVPPPVMEAVGATIRDEVLRQ